MILLEPKSLDQRQGLLCLIAKVEPYELGTVTPNFRAPRLGPWAFSIRVLNSVAGNVVWKLHPSSLPRPTRKLFAFMLI